MPQNQSSGTVGANWPLLVILLAALASSVAAGWYSGTEAGAGMITGHDLWAIPFWLTPLAYLAFGLIFAGGGLNKPAIAVAAVMVAAASIALLFVPLPPPMKWHWIWGIAVAIAIFGHDQLE